MHHQDCKHKFCSLPYQYKLSARHLKYSVFKSYVCFISKSTVMFVTVIYSAILQFSPDNVGKKIQIDNTYQELTWTFHVSAEMLLLLINLNVDFSVCSLKNGNVKEQISLLKTFHFKPYENFQILPNLGLNILLSLLLFFSDNVKQKALQMLNFNSV